MIVTTNSAGTDDDGVIRGDGVGPGKASARQFANAHHSLCLCPTEGLVTIGGIAYANDGGAVRGNAKGLAKLSSARKPAKTNYPTARRPAKCLKDFVVIPFSVASP